MPLTSGDPVAAGIEKPRPDVLLVTVNEHETKAVHDAFLEATGAEGIPVPLEGRLYHNLGTINGTTVYHAISEMGSSGLGAMQQAVDKAIRALDPGAVIAVGIAFGVSEEDQSIGDILLSKQLQLYDLQRVGTEIVLRGDKAHAAPRLINHFEAFRQVRWKGARVRPGLVLSGEKLIDDKDYRDQLVSLQGEAVGGEMEGAGLYVASADHKVDWVVVKAICDWADGSKKVNKKQRQKKAAKSAAEFVVESLKYAPLKRIDPARAAQNLPKRVGADSVSRDTDLWNFYLQPNEVFERVCIDDYAPRPWLEDQLDAFLADEKQDRGVWLLVGEAGMGKTAFMAHLARSRDYIHFFSEQAPGDINVLRAVHSIGIQLIAKYQLDQYTDVANLPQEIGRIPGFLERLLWLASDKGGEKSRIVLLLDGLDEAGIVPGGNVLGLPRQLPAGVYLILSQRPQAVTLHVNPVPRRVTLFTDSSENRADVERYIRQIAQKPKVHEAIQNSSSSINEFVHTLLEKSLGNWMFLHCILDEIQRGRRRPDDMDSLPEGLAAYYGQYWNRWRTHANWNGVYAPILATLAAAFEPLTPDRLRTWAAVNVSEYEIGRIIREEWRAFVHQVGKAQPGYRIYHSSLRQFLHGELASAELSPALEMCVEDLYDWVRRAHQRIAAELLGRNRGEWSEAVKDDYARRYLCAHLRLAGQQDACFALIDSESWYAGQLQTDASGATYLNDVAQAWKAAEDEYATAVAEGVSPPRLERQLQCALTESSIHSTSCNVPGELLIALLREGVWNASTVLSNIRLRTDSHEQEKLLTGVLPFLSGADFVELISTLRAIDSPFARSDALVACAARFPAEFLSDALGIALGIGQESYSYALSRALAGLAPFLPRALALEALKVAETIGDFRHRGFAIRALAAHLPEDDRPNWVVAAAAEEMKWQFTAVDRVKIFCELLPIFDSDKRQETLDWMVEQTGKGDSSDDRDRVEVICELVPHMRLREFHPILNIIASIKREDERARALRAITPTLPPAFVGRVWRMVTSSFDPPRVDILADLIPRLPASLLSKATDTVRAVCARLAPDWRRARHDDLFASFFRRESPADLMRVYGELSTRLAGPAGLLLQEAIDVLVSLPSDERCLEAVAELAPFLPPHLALQALEASSRPQYSVPKLHAVLALARRIDEPQRATVLQEALEFTRTIGDKGPRVAAFIRLGSLLPPAERRQLLLEALASCSKIGDSASVARTLAAVTSCLPSAEQPERIRDTVQAISTLDDAAASASILVELSGLLPSSEALVLITDAFGRIRTIDDRRSRTWCARDFIPIIPEHLIPELTDILWEDGLFFPDDLARLAPRFSPSQLRHTLERIVGVRSAYDRVKLTAVLAPYLPQPEQWPLFATLLPWVREDTNVNARAATLARVVPFAPQSEQGDLIAETIESIRCVSYFPDQMRTLASLLSHLRGPVRDLPLDVAMTLLERYMSQLTEYAKTEDELIHRDLNELDIDAVAQAFGKRDESELHVPDALKELAPHLPDSQFARVAEYACSLKEDHRQAEAIRHVAPYARGDSLQKLLSVVRKMSVRFKTEVYPSIIRQIADPERSFILDDALSSLSQWVLSGHDIEEVAEIVLLFAPDDQPRAIRKLFDLWSTNTDSINPHTIARLFACCRQLPASEVYPVWNLYLHTIATRQRSECMTLLRPAFALSAAIGDARSLHAMFGAIHSILTRWS